MMNKFYPIGSAFDHPIYGKCILAQVDDGKGAVISLTEGNRVYSPRLLDYNHNHPGYGAWNTSKIFGDFFETMEQETVERKEREDKVHFFRYIRPRNVWGGVDSRRGVTFSIELDYVKRIARYGFCICEGENFDKVVGRALSAGRRMFKSSPYYYELYFGDQVDSCGSVTQLIYFLSDVYHHLSPEQQQLVKKLYHMYSKA